MEYIYSCLYVTNYAILFNTCTSLSLLETEKTFGTQNIVVDGIFDTTQMLVAPLQQ